jgi:hypothetical protein
MMGQVGTDLSTLIANLDPFLHESPYVFCSVAAEDYRKLPFEPLGVFSEPEGVTIISTEERARENGLPFAATWACITLRVHSSLSAVGFVAAVTARLAEAGLSVNPVSAFYHDHLFVPWQKRRRAMVELQELSQAQSAKQRALYKQGTPQPPNEG